MNENEVSSDGNKFIGKTTPDTELVAGRTYCAFCGESFAVDAPNSVTAVVAHIHTCHRHPMRVLEARITELENQLTMARLQQHPPVTRVIKDGVDVTPNS